MSIIKSERLIVKLLLFVKFEPLFRADREIVREIIPEGQFVEVFVDASLIICCKRDPKGLYAKAIKGEIKQFTGIDSPYEYPFNPEVTLEAGDISVAKSVNNLLAKALHTGSNPLK